METTAIAADRKRVFVIMPFGGEFDAIYEEIIQEPFADAGYDVIRADAIRGSENILSSIIKLLNASELIVADLSTANPNVLYELGIAHALNKKVILIVQIIEDLPFDLRSYRFIEYGKNQISKMRDAKKEIRELIESVKSGDAKFGNPVTDFSGIDHALSSDIDDEYNDDNGDLGFMDYQDRYLENTETLSSIITGVSERLNTITYKLNTNTKKLEERGQSNSQNMYIIRSIAVDINDYAKWLKGANAEYRQSLSEVGENLDKILDNNLINSEDETVKEKMRQLLRAIDDGIYEIDASMANSNKLVQALDSAPQVERNFNRAKRFMSRETKIFTENMNQTQEVFQSIIDKYGGRIQYF